MDPEFAAEHALAVAREAVKSGLTDRATATRLYWDYSEYLKRGSRGSFTQLLLSRGVVDPAGAARLEALVPTDRALPPQEGGLPPAPPGTQFDSGEFRAFEALAGQPPRPDSSSREGAGRRTTGRHVASDPRASNAGGYDPRGTGRHAAPVASDPRASNAGGRDTGRRASGQLTGSLDSGAHKLATSPGPRPDSASGPITPAPKSGGWGAGGWGAAARAAEESFSYDPDDSFVDEGPGARPPRPQVNPALLAAPDADLTLQYDEVLDPRRGKPPSRPFRVDRSTTLEYDAVLPAKQTSVPGLSDSAEYSPVAAPGGLRDGQYVGPAGLVDDGLDSTSGDSRAVSEGLAAGGLGRIGDSSEEGLALVGAEGEAEAAAFYAPSADEEAGEDDTHTFREPAVGERLGRYELLKVLGRGGMGVIYQARKEGDAQVYALKALMAGKGASAVKRRARFQREFEALQRLRHDNIVSVHACGRQGPFDYYVMDYIQGRELKEVLKADAAKLDQPEKLRMFLDVCQAVSHAHAAGVVHRDLKPANVLVDGEGKVFVLDFGLAKLTDEDDELTKTGAALGTPFYMSPEQLMNPKDADARMDVFSLGVMLYEMLTGKRPFLGETTGELINRIMNDDPAPPSKVDPALGAQVDAICLKALEKDPLRRYQSVDALRSDVARLRRGTAVKSKGAADQAVDQARRYFERNRLAIVLTFFASALFWIPFTLIAKWILF